MNARVIATTPSRVDFRAIIGPEIRTIRFSFKLRALFDEIPGDFDWDPAKPGEITKSRTDEQLAEAERRRAQRRFIRQERVRIGNIATGFADAGFSLAQARGTVRLLEASWMHEDDDGQIDPLEVLRANFTFDRLPQSMHRLQADYLDDVGMRTFAALCSSAMWTVDGLRNSVNPDEAQSWALNCNCRLPFYLFDGQRNCARARDASGAQVGKPIPIEPSGIIEVRENALCCMR